MTLADAFHCLAVGDSLSDLLRGISPSATGSEYLSARGVSVGEGYETHVPSGRADRYSWSLIGILGSPAAIDRERGLRSPRREAPPASFQREHAAFQRLLPSLLQHHRGKYVAIVDGCDVATDANQLRLVERVRRDYPGRFVLVRRVDESSRDRVEYLESPEGG